MNLSKLLGLELKSDAMIEVLHTCCVEAVVYDFDRLDKGVPDVYWAAAKARGFLLRFNERQICDVVFCYVQPSEGFRPVDPSWIGTRLFGTFNEAESACRESGFEYSVAGPAMANWWLMVNSEPFQPHYEFKGGTLFRVTLSTLSPS